MTVEGAAQIIAASFFLFVCVFTIVMALVIMSILPRRTNDYRKDLTNLYVAGMIRKYADKDNVDLDEEQKTFLSWKKRAIIYEKQLDNVIELELKEKIANVNGEKAIKE